MRRQIFKCICYANMAIILTTATLHTAPAKAPAAWSILAYIQADNDLAPYANYNIHDMELALARNIQDEAPDKSKSNEFNMLVQWDQPRNNKTWRYRITQNGRVEDESVNQEMGINPAQEIIDSMKWVQRKYPADHYALILWNHGSGVEDYRTRFPQFPKEIAARLGHAWLSAPGLFPENRGILYDDSQNTCLTNQGLQTALATIKTNLGKNIDILGMDACLMAMVEIVYQVKEYANILVASEETEPGYGWSYSGFLAPLSLSASTFTPEILAQAIVYAYGKYYESDDPDYSLSAIYVNKIAGLKTNIDLVINQIAACKKYVPSDIKNKVVNARRAAQTFAIDSYIDLYSFYTELIKQCSKSAPKSAKILNQISKQKITHDARYTKAINDLSTSLTAGLSQIRQLVFANVAGSGVPNTHGISIYYPNTRYSSSQAIHPSYLKTRFAKDSKWLNFIKEYRSK